MKNLVREAVGDLHNIRMLDLGCGTGSYHEGLSKHVAALCGVDVDQQSLVLAARRDPSVMHASFDGSQLPFATGSFGAVFAMCVFHHVNPDNRDELLREAARVLRPGGLMVIGEHNPYNPLTRAAVFKCKFDVDVKLLTARQTVKRLADAGLQPASSNYTLVFPFQGRVFRRIEHQMRRLPIGAQYLVVGRKPS
jgi:ubiquinone/menaquinone biosynthesis C-methylase UbiE